MDSILDNNSKIPLDCDKFRVIHDNDNSYTITVTITILIYDNDNYISGDSYMTILLSLIPVM